MRISIIGTGIKHGRACRACIALALWILALLLTVRLRASVLALLLGTYIVVDRLQPFLFQGIPRAFGWLPFRSFMTGSLEVDLMAFLVDLRRPPTSTEDPMTETEWRLSSCCRRAARAISCEPWRCRSSSLPGGGAQVRGPSARLGAYDVAGKFPHRVIYPPVRRQGFRDNGLGKLREALAHRVGEVRQPAAGAASGD